MKKILYILLFLLSFSLSAYGDSFEEFDFDEAQIDSAQNVTPETNSQPSNTESQPILLSQEMLQTMLASQQDQKYQQWTQVVRDQSDNNFKIIITLCVVLLLSLLFLLYFLRNRDSRDIVSGVGLNLIIFGTVIMVMVAQTDQQLTAGAGILGAIAGYLFRSIQNDDPRPAPPENKS
ncbi:MAG: hypothetical protein Q9M28_06455 [Mariprofundaceae bacterium]|nr:hypothetical protein [Mariprofundaceae bacterium]